MKSREIELKLELASGRIEDLLEHPAFNQAKPLSDQSGTLHAVYYDTPWHALRRAGLSLRVRERNGHHVQTIKAERTERGLALDRTEWECPVEGTIDLEAAACTPLASLLADEETRESIQPIFAVETNRQVLEIEREAALVEVALDRAEAKVGEQFIRFAEVELELKQGNPSALFALARDLEDIAPLRLSTTTKSERGYRLLGEEDAGAVHASPVDVPPGTTGAEAFQVIARSCLFQIVRNEAVVRRDSDPEALHQMRVGLRRLNAAQSLFKPMLKGREGRAVKADLRWIGKKFGRVRDLDIYANRLREAESEVESSALKDVEKQRSDAYDSLRRTLEKPRFMGVILRVAAWIETGKWLSSKKKRVCAARGELVEDRALKQLTRRWKRIRKRAGKVSNLDERQRHRLRMSIKTLRYGVEFFAATFPGRQADKRHHALLSVLQDLQDELGEMNDITVARTLFPELAKQEAGQAEQRLNKLLSRAEVASRKLQKTKPFWDRTAATH